MASGISDYLETELMDFIFRDTAIYTRESTTKVALYTVAPTDAGGGTEVTGGSYAQQTVTNATGWSGAANTTDNVAAIDFGTASASWGTVVACAIKNAANTQFLVWGDLTASKAVGNGDSFQFPIGDLDVSID